MRDYQPAIQETGCWHNLFIIKRMQEEWADSASARARFWNLRLLDGVNHDRGRANSKIVLLAQLSAELRQFGTPEEPE